jgi:hypothetical protein
MKYIVLLISLLAVFARCKDSEADITNRSKSVSIAIIFDFTDKKKLWPLPDPILELYQCEKFPATECIFRATAITDKSINPTFCCHLPDVAETEKGNVLDDAQHRNREIVGFYQCVRKKVSYMYSQFDTTNSFAYSECWATVCTELQQLSREQSAEKYLILFGDLLEKSALFDAYGQAMAMDVQAIAEKFEHAGSLPESLKGITIICVYQPPTREDDAKFNTMISVYKACLEKRGARFVVQANNKEFSL